MSVEKSQIRSSNRMKVANMAFLLERLAKDCSAFQFIRELTQNAIEAILASNKPGIIHWSIDKTEVLGPNKLCIIDTGIGMEPDSMMLYLNNISCSSSEQGLSGNFGFGGKITAVAENPYGVMYYSWTGSTADGGAVLIGRDGDYYGAKDILSEGTTQDHLASIGSDYMPKSIRTYGGTGTKVILGGKSRNDNTCQPLGSDGSRVGGQWVSRYLNERYFRIPDSVTIRCDEIRSDGKSNPRTVRGQGWVNDRCKLKCGVVPLPDTNARAHWWIMDTAENLKSVMDPDDSVGNRGKTYSTNFYTSGHTGFLYKNEIYSINKKGQSTSRLHKCGVLFGAERVVIYIEPLDKSVISNTSRTQLTSEGDDLDWDLYAAEFRERMPVELSEFIDSIGSNAQRGSLSVTHKERIMEVANLFTGTKEVAKPDPNGSSSAGEDSDLCGGGEDGGSGSRGSGNGSTHKPPSKGRRKNTSTKIKAGVLKPRSRRSTITRTPDLPEILWVSRDSGTRSDTDMDNRVGRYDEECNKLFLNSDYFGYRNWVEHFTNQYPSSDLNQMNAVRSKVKDIVQRHFEFVLLETIVTYPDLATIHDWPYTGGISPESLTLAIQPRYHLSHAIKRDVRQELGAPTREMSVKVSFTSDRTVKPNPKPESHFASQ